MGNISSCSSGKGRSHQNPVKYGYSLVKGKANHPMEDYHVAKFAQSHGHEVGLFAIYDGHLGDSVPAYLQKNLFANILKDVRLKNSHAKWSSISLEFYSNGVPFLVLVNVPLRKEAMLR